MRIGFVGTGTIAAAMVNGIAADGHEIIVSQRNAVISAELAAQHPNVTVADNQTVVDNSNIIILGLLAPAARIVLPDLTFQPHQRVFSVIVGITFADLSAWVTPAQEVSTFIPYPFIAQGDSPLLVYPHSETLNTLFGQRNHLITLTSEQDMNSYLAAQAVLSPTVKLLHETAGWLAKRTGDAVSAEKFLRILIGNYLTATSLDQPDTLAAMLRDLGTEGGLNAQLRDHFTEQGVFETLETGLDALEKRFDGSQ